MVFGENAIHICIYDCLLPKYIMWEDESVILMDHEMAGLFGAVCVMGGHGYSHKTWIFGISRCNAKITIRVEHCAVSTNSVMQLTDKPISGVICFKPLAWLGILPVWQAIFIRADITYLKPRKFGHLAIAVSPRLEVEIGGHASLDGCNFQRKRPGPHGVPPAPPCVHRLPRG